MCCVRSIYILVAILFVSILVAILFIVITTYLHCEDEIRFEIEKILLFVCALMGLNLLLNFQ